MGLKVTALRFRSGFLVAVAAQSGETRWCFAPGRLGSAVIGLGCVSKWERRAGRGKEKNKAVDFKWASGDVYYHGYHSNKPLMLHLEAEMHHFPLREKMFSPGRPDISSHSKWRSFHHQNKLIHNYSTLLQKGSSKMALVWSKWLFASLQLWFLHLSSFFCFFCSCTENVQ